MNMKKNKYETSPTIEDIQAALLFPLYQAIRMIKAHKNKTRTENMNENHLTLLGSL